MFFGQNDAKAETPILWPLHAKNWLIGKDSDSGRVWGQEEKGTTEEEMSGLHHWIIDMSLSEFRELVLDRETWCAAIHGVSKSWTWLSDWTDLKFPLMHRIRVLRIFIILPSSWNFGNFLYYTDPLPQTSKDTQGVKQRLSVFSKYFIVIHNSFVFPSSVLAPDFYAILI